MPLEEFFKKAWEVTEPGKPLMLGWHIGLICEHLEAVSRGQIKKLLVNIPPRSLKSTIISVDWPTWEWGPLGHPEYRYLFVSHEIGLSTELSLNRRLILESDWYRENWPRVVIATDQNEKRLIHNTRRGKMIATSQKGAITGKGGNRLVFDDFIDPEQAESDLERNSALSAWEKKFSSRLDDPANDAIVVVEQRTHPQDFTAKLIEEGGFTRITIPSDNYTKEPMFFSFPSGRVVEIAPGASTFPERKPLDLIEAQRRRMGSRTHDAQERQNPQAAGGIIFKRENWRFYDNLEELIARGFDEMLQSWDLSFKGTSDSDFVVGQVWGRRAADHFFLDQFRDQVGVLGTMSAIEMMTSKWPRATRKLVEDKANGPAVIELLRTKVPGLIAVNPQGGKIVRARAAEPFQESGNLWLPSPRIAPWVEDFISRSAQFPNVDRDDEIDAMTQAIIHFTSNSGPMLTIG